MVGWKQCDGSLMRLRRRSPEKRLTGERSGHYLIKFSSFHIESKRCAHNFLCLGSARAGRLCWVERGDEQGNQQPEEQAQVGVQSGGGSNLSLLVPIKISSPNFSFFLFLHIYCVCCNRELADCENIAFLTANADSTKKSRYMGGVVLSVWDWCVCVSRCEYCDQYLPLCVWASLGLFHCCLSPISQFWTVSWDRLTAWKQGRSTEWWINNGRRCLLQEYQISNIGSPEMWPLPVRSLRKQRLSAPKKLNWWSKSKTLRTSFLSRKFIPRNVLFMS